MAPTDVKFPLSPSGQIIPYNYSIDYSPMKGVDVLGEFIKSCEKKQIKTGFYYTVATNNWFNVESGLVSLAFTRVFCNIIIDLFNIKVRNRTLQPGQVNVTQETYDSIVLQQLREIWTRYGTLDEVWFDGGSVL
jgi:hypothetical protein